MPKKKFFHLITGLDVGGAEMMLLKTLPRLQEHFDNEVCCLRGHGPVGKRLEGAGIPVHYLGLTPTNLIPVILRFRTLVKRFQPDLLVTYLIHSDIFGRIFGRLFGIGSIICNERGFYLDWQWLRTIDRFTAFLVDRYFVQTETAKRILMDTLHLPENKFSVIPNTIDFREYSFPIDRDAKRAELGIPQDNTVIVCVSNLKPRKGYEELLEAFEQLHHQSLPVIPSAVEGSQNKQKPIMLLIVGDGTEKEKYLNQIKDYASKKGIHFLGKRNDVKEILRVSDIFVLATYSEGMSNALLEAMASRLAIVTTDIDVNREVIDDGVSGLLVPIRDAAALTAKLSMLITDETMRRSLGEHAYREALRKYEIDSVINRITTLYEEVLSQR